MPQNQTKNNVNNHHQQEQSGNWFLPAIIGAAIGGAAALLYSKSQQQGSQQCRSGTTNSTSSGDPYVSNPRGCCTICQDNYAETKRLSCGHIIHKDCYEALKLHTRGALLCPMCRLEVD